MRINASSLTARHTLELRPDGVTYVSGMTAAGSKFFRFEQIDAILRGAQSLSFQVGRDTYSIPIKPTDPEHRTFAARFASEVKRTVRKG
jgi:hypothetical protein